MWLPFVTHSKDTAGVIEKLFDKGWLSNNEIIFLGNQLGVGVTFEEARNNALRFCKLVALLHDIGKITPAFQNKIVNSIADYKELLSKYSIDVEGLREPNKSPHNIAGQAILEKFGFSEEFAVIVGSHHGKPASAYIQFDVYYENYYGNRSAQKKEWEQLWKDWIDFSLSECGYQSAKDVPVPNVKVQMIVTALLIMSDWIASNPKYFQLVNTFEVPNEQEQHDRVEKAWEILGLSECWNVDSLGDTEEMFEQRFEFEPNAVQKEVMEIVSGVSEQGIYILEAPMGIGKTETALAMAEILSSKFNCGGVYFGLPTQATANGIYKRINNWAENQSKDQMHTIRLAHGMTELNNEYSSLFRGSANDVSDEEGVFVHEWFEGRKQALLAEFVIATVDQLLLASLKQRHVMLRHLGLLGKIVIIDECHAYDAYMNIYLDKTLTWLGVYRVPVIILSATLPPKRRKELIEAYLKLKKDITIPENTNNTAYPMLTWTDTKNVYFKPLSANSDKEIFVDRLDESELIQRLEEKLSMGGCAAIIITACSHKRFTK